MIKDHPHWIELKGLEATRIDNVKLSVGVVGYGLEEFDFEVENHPICWTAFSSNPNSSKFDIDFRGWICLPSEIKTLVQAIEWVDLNYPVKDVSEKLAKQIREIEACIEDEQFKLFVSQQKSENRIKNLVEQLAKLKK